MLPSFIYIGKDMYKCSIYTNCKRHFIYKIIVVILIIGDEKNKLITTLSNESTDFGISARNYKIYLVGVKFISQVFEDIEWGGT